jgi:RNA polymerase sigma-70 factor, ECF subfamily
MWVKFYGDVLPALAVSRSDAGDVTTGGSVRYHSVGTAELTEPARRRQDVAGSLAPFEDVYRAHLDAVFRFCLSQLRDRDAAEEVTAEVFSAALTAYARVQPDEGVLTWLMSIARNRVVDHFRATRRRELLASFLRHRWTSSPDPSEVAEANDDLARAGRAIAKLDQRKRLLVGLRVASQLSYAEIGEVMGISETAARVATHRALRKVRATLEES